MSKVQKGASAPVSEPVQQATQKRIYKDAMTFDHDLFRLEISTLMRNMSWTKKKPVWEPFEHKHFFHTFDSDGRKQERCVAALGHYHPMEVINNGPDQIPTVICGPATKDVLTKDEDGNYKKVPQALTGREQHTHEVSWVISEKLTTRKVNPEAIKAQSHIMSKANPNFTDDERKVIKETGRDKVTE